MAGRPKAPATIVDASRLLTVTQSCAEHWTLSRLAQQINGTESCLQWLACRLLIKNSLECSKCFRQVALQRSSRGVDGKRWCCGPCGVTFSVRKGSFFEKSHLTLEQIIVIMYCWAVEAPSHFISREVVVSGHVLVEWLNFCRVECGRWLAQNPPEIGGFQENGEPVVVEIGGRKFFHSICHKGQWLEGHWVFGGVERGSRKCFLVEVPDCTAGTVEDVIQQYILPGSHIISDDRDAFKNISMLKGGIYFHSVALHNNFVSSEDVEVHLETIENIWLRAQRKLKRKFGMQKVSLATYLDEFVWRNSCKDNDPFSSFLICLSENYGLG